MVAKLIGLPSLCVLLGLFTSTAAQTVEILNPGQVTYVDSNVYGVLGKAVILDCGGNTLPDVYFWSFTKPGTNAAKAVVYDLGKGPRVQALAQTLGDLRIISQSASISIENLPLAAHGLYTCQAIYDRPPEAAVYYYYVYLTVRVPVSKPYVQMGDASPVEGTSVWLRCALENGSDPVLYVWEHETRNSVVTVFAQGNNSRINVTDVNRNHTGWYRCVASNPVNSERSDRIWLDIIFGPDQPQIDVTPYSVAERGYSALERETVSLLCQAQSNPPSQYMWLYNNSQVYAGQQFTITKILRMHTGNYACLAQNTYLNTRSIKTISLTVYYPPDGSPSCLVEAAVNHTSFKLLCSWPEGVPSPSLSWTRGPLALGQETIELSNNATLPQSVALKSNNTLFTCTGSHPAILDTKYCSIRTYSPPARPECLANVTSNNQYLMLSCFWNGGVPRALLWWEGPGGQGQAGEENSKVWAIPYGTGQSGLYTCHAKHPLLAQNKSCSLTLEAPVLVTQRRVVSVYEGSDVQLTCNMRSNYSPADEVTWFNNQRKVVGDDPNKYLLQQAATWANLTVRQADVSQDSGQYWCAASNAVGGAEISVTLLVMRYPMPPNVTLVKVMYSSRQHSEVELEWKTEEDRGLSGFILEHRWKQGSTGSSVWLQTVIQDPLARSHRLASLTPTFTYQIRITAVNHRTTGHPSVVITPDPPDGSPSCSVEAAVNHTSFKLLCSWPGGVPSPSLSWTRGPLALGQETIELSNNATLPQSVALKSNYTLFTCTGSHPALKESPYCSIRTYSPPAEPSCSAYATGNNHHLMLSCFWNGGVPRALLWWEGPGGQSQAGEENSNILVLRYGTAQSGQSYTCRAKHPLLAQSKTCSLTLEAPVLVTQRRVVSVYEGSDVQLTCNMRANYPPADEVTWFNNQRKVVGDDPNKYLLQQAATWANLTVRQADVSQDSGQYWCAASNAVGGAEISVTLLVMRYPMPPNVTLVKVMYIHQRSEVELEWKTEEDEALSGFILEHRWLAEQRAARSSNVSEESPVWLQTVIQDPLARSHRLASLTPTFTYQIRIKAVNYRTIGHPSVVYSPDPPDESPSCLVEAAVNHTSFKLLCSWPGGVPSPSLSWTRGPLALGQETIELSNNATLPQSVALKSNNTLFTCTGSHPALLDTKYCSIRTYTPPSDPECSAYATRYNQYLMLSCFWNGGVPRALLWWEGPGGQSQAGEENSNILVLRYGTAQSGQPYTCRAKHPLLAQSKTCSLTLEAPVLVIQRRFVSVYEGNDVQLTCNVRANFLPADEVTWFNNQTKDVWNDPNKYLLQRSAAWANLTVRETDGTQDSGQYWCTASNAVGGAEIPVTLLVMRHPMPPNATLVKVAYSSHQRSEVELEWKTEGDGGSAGEPVQALTGFVLEHARVAARPGSSRSSRSSSSSYASGKTQESTESTVWLQSVILNPATRSHRLASLTPTFTYQIRIRAVNHRTLGHPSAVKTPADPPFNSYPAVIGAAIGGMLFAAIITVLLLIYIIRNRNNNPRIHDLLFGRQNSQSRENINFPEDEVVAGAEEPEVQASSSPAPAMALPRAASPLSATPTPGQAPPPGDDNEPVNVTITVQAVGS